MVLDATQHYKLWIKGKVEQIGNGVAPFLTPYGSAWKGYLQVTLNYSRQVHLEFERAYYNFKVQNISHYATKTLPIRLVFYGIPTLVGYLMPNLFSCIEDL